MGSMHTNPKNEVRIPRIILGIPGMFHKSKMVGKTNSLQVWSLKGILSQPVFR